MTNDDIAKVERVLKEYAKEGTLDSTGQFVRKTKDGAASLGAIAALAVDTGEMTVAQFIDLPGSAQHFHFMATLTRTFRKHYGMNTVDRQIAILINDATPDPMLRPAMIAQALRRRRDSLLAAGHAHDSTAPVGPHGMWA